MGVLPMECGGQLQRGFAARPHPPSAPSPASGGRKVGRCQVLVCLGRFTVRNLPLLPPPQ
jgi:hypothetical protein